MQVVDFFMQGHHVSLPNRDSLLRHVHSKLLDLVWAECDELMTGTPASWETGGSMMIRPNTTSHFPLPKEQPHPFPYPFPSHSCHNVAMRSCQQHKGLFNGYEMVKNLAHGDRLRGLLDIKMQHPKVNALLFCHINR